VFVDKHGNGYLVEQVREVGVSLDGMVGKGIRVLSSWVGFSCLTVLFLAVDRSKVILEVLVYVWCWREDKRRWCR
jgi:hypothetical protein